MGGYMNKLKKDNRGLSLIELIVVVAIMGILLAGGINYLGLLSSHSAKETATKLKSAMTEARTEAMSKSQASLRIYEDGSEYYAELTVNGKIQSPVQIGNSRVEVTYERVATVEENLPVDGLVIEFDRDTGAFKPVDVLEGKNVYCRKIIVTAGSRSYILSCERLTGKVIVE